MTRSLTIALLLSVAVTTCSQSSPSDLLETFCPCRPPSSCTQIFGTSDDAVFTDILRAIPECLPQHVRCCSKEVMFTTLMTIVRRFGGDAAPLDSVPPPSDGGGDPDQSDRRAKSAGSRTLFFTSESQDLEGNDQSGFDVAEEQGRSRPGSSGRLKLMIPAGAQRAGGPGVGAGAQSSSSRVSCIPAASCAPGNIYGTKSQHFTQFGFISPTDNKCFADSGNILCVVDAAEVDVDPVEQPAAPGFPLPCVEEASCSEVFGTKKIHLNEFGPQTACPSEDKVRCVSSDPVQSPVKSDATLPAGTDLFKPFVSKIPSEPTKAVPAAPLFLTPSEPEVPPPVLPSFAQPPLLPSAPPKSSGTVVNIIGPQPIYISYDVVQGPSVGEAGSLVAGGSQSSLGSPTESQIRVLIAAIKQKLRSILLRS